MIRAAIRKRVDEGVDERLVVETDFAAGGVAGVVTLEGSELVNEPVGLRAMVVRAARRGLLPRTVDISPIVPRRRLPIGMMRVTVMVSVPPVSCQSNSLPPPRGSLGLGAASGLSVFLNSTRYTTSSLRLVPLAMWNS